MFNRSGQRFLATLRATASWRLIAQMVGAGQLIKLLFGLEYWIAVVIVGGLMMVYVLFGGMTQFPKYCKAMDVRDTPNTLRSRSPLPQHH